MQKKEKKSAAADVVISVIAIIICMTVVMICKKATSDTGDQPEKTLENSAASLENLPHTAMDLREQTKKELDRICMEKYGNIDSLFEAYNGGKLQVIVTGNQSPAANDSICFYKKDPVESVDEAVQIMFCAILDTLTMPSDDRPFTVLKYELPDQTILSSQEVTERILAFADRVWESGSKDPYECITSADLEEGLFPIAEGMYEIIGFHGSYAYDGTDFIPFQDALEEAKKNGTASDDGMIPFTAQGSAGITTYILMEKNGVYRLQRTDTFKELGSYRQKNRIFFGSSLRHSKLKRLLVHL